MREDLFVVVRAAAGIALDNVDAGAGEECHIQVSWESQEVIVAVRKEVVDDLVEIGAATPVEGLAEMEVVTAVAEEVGGQGDLAEPAIHEHELTAAEFPIGKVLFHPYCLAWAVPAVAGSTARELAHRVVALFGACVRPNFVQDEIALFPFRTLSQVVVSAGPTPGEIGHFFVVGHPNFVQACFAPSHALDFSIATGGSIGMNLAGLAHSNFDRAHHKADPAYHTADHSVVA
jgi:hypothetical protein